MNLQNILAVYSALKDFSTGKEYNLVVLLVAICFVILTESS